MYTCCVNSGNSSRPPTISNNIIGIKMVATIVQVVWIVGGLGIVMRVSCIVAKLSLRWSLAGSPLIVCLFIMYFDIVRTGCLTCINAISHEIILHRIKINCYLSFVYCLIHQRVPLKVSSHQSALQ